MAEEIDESGFYREDFSTESDWEVFNAQLGELFQAWELSSTDWGREFEQNELFHCEWLVQSEKINLLKKEFAVSYYKAQLKQCKDVAETQPETTAPMHKDLMSLKNTFGPPLDGRNKSLEMHALARLYGLRRFVVMHPVGKRFLSIPAEFSFFLSAATVVAAETCSTVPIFVQIYDPKWNFFVGIGAAPTLRTNFDLVALDQAPSGCRYLAGLMSMFKEKLPAIYLRSATVSVRNTYALETVQVRIAMNIPFSRVPSADDDKESNTTTISTSTFIALPYGYVPDSCTEMYIIYTWPEMAENIAIDSELHSDFVPSKAPFGSIYQVVHATSYLSSCLQDFRKLHDASEALESYVGRNFSGTASAAEVANPLDKLTQPHLRHLSRSHKHRPNFVMPTKFAIKKLPGPMNENELSQMLLYLFADSDSVMFPYADKTSKQRFDPHRVKSAVPDSLVARLSCLLVTCNAHFGGKSGLAQLWAAFTCQLRFHWDFCLAINGVAKGFPDTRTCLLHQKLQMLNICIQRSALREQDHKSEPAQQTSSSTKSAAVPVELEEEEEEADEEEFYDCEDPALNLNKAEGRLKRLGDMKLLDSDEPLYVPVTQDIVPKTEDQLQDDAEVMLKLGPGSGLTTQMMCSSLLSDMEAFKAANPKAQMEDFIRWYSPKDWEETTNEQGEVEGKMSARMLAPDNTWQTVWKQAHAVAAWRQKRLFDDTNEALKVLHYLETRTIGEIYELTVVPVLHAAILKLQDIFENTRVLDIFNVQIDELLSDLCRLSRDIEIVGQNELGSIIQAPNPEPIIEKIALLEKQFYQFKCFERISGYPLCIKLPELKQQFEEILKNDGSCHIKLRRDPKSAADGNATVGFLNPSFKNEMRESLISKDYVIRIDGETTTSVRGQTVGPQYLRAIVTGEKLRLCGAFTESTTFV